MQVDLCAKVAEHHCKEPLQISVSLAILASPCLARNANPSAAKLGPGLDVTLAFVSRFCVQLITNLNHGCQARSAGLKANAPQKINATSAMLATCLTRKWFLPKGWEWALC